jgi:hypothetical protein
MKILGSKIRLALAMIVLLDVSLACIFIESEG